AVAVFTSGQVVRVPPDATLHEVADALVDAGVGALVVGDGDRAEATVSERDVVLALAGRRHPATPTAPDIASDTLACCDAGPPRAEVAALMMPRYVRHVLVERDGRLVGIVSARNLLGTFAGGEV